MPATMLAPFGPFATCATTVLCSCSSFGFLAWAAAASLIDDLIPKRNCDFDVSVVLRVAVKHSVQVPPALAVARALHSRNAGIITTPEALMVYQEYWPKEERASRKVLSVSTLISVDALAYQRPSSMSRARRWRCALH